MASVISAAWRVAVSTVLGLLLTVLGVSLAAPASAHTHLLSSNPADGTTVAVAPTQLTLVFDEAIDPAFLELAVTNAAGTTVSATPPAVAGAQVTQALPPLPNDTYTAAFRLVSDDGHPTSATLTFTVAAPVASSSAPPTSAVPSPTTSGTGAPATSAATPVPTDTAATSSTQGGGAAAKVIGAIGIGLVALLAGATLARMRRNAPKEETPTTWLHEQRGRK